MKKIISIILSSILLLSSLFVFGCSEVLPELDKRISVSALSCEMYGASTFNEEDNSVSKKIKATIYPENAYNKKVDFFVRWDSSAALQDELVTDYVTVTQTSDGSLEATVTCHKSFRDNKILIDVISRDSNRVGTCSVTYVGIASEISISTDLELLHSEERGDFYLLETGKQHFFDVILDNCFGDVGYDLSVKLDYYGELWTARGSQDFETFKVETCTFEKVVMGESSFLSSYSFSNNTLILSGFSQAIFSMDNFDSIPSGSDCHHFSTGALFSGFDSMDWGDFSSDYEKYRNENLSLVDSCYVKVTIIENYSGLSTSFNFISGLSVDYLELDNSEITF